MKDKEKMKIKLKSFKIDVSASPYLSEAVQKHAFDLGWWWFHTVGTTAVLHPVALHTEQPYIFLHSDKGISVSANKSFFKCANKQKINFLDFLKLTKEDVQIKEEKELDWLKPLMTKHGDIVFSWESNIDSPPERFFTISAEHPEKKYEVVLSYNEKGNCWERFGNLCCDLKNLTPHEPWALVHNKEKTKAHFFFGDEWEIKKTTPKCNCGNPSKNLLLGNPALCADCKKPIFNFEEFK